MILSNKDKGSKIYSFFNFFLILIVICLVWLYFNIKDIKRFFQAMELLDKEKNSVYVLEKNNQKLKQEIGQLKNDPEYVEKIAREQHKLKKVDEKRLIIEADKKEDKK